MTSWLKSFRSATTQMSTSKRSMLSSAHAIYRGLQDSLQDSLRALPNNTHPNLKLGLLNAHRKLSDYYNKIDDSPFYTWASRTFISFSYLLLCGPQTNICSLVLDPRISYEGLLHDCGTDPDAIHTLSNSRAALLAYCDRKYASSSVPTIPSSQPSQPLSSFTPGSPDKVNFTARYKTTSRVPTNELEEYFKLPIEDFDSCDPIQWWFGRRAQFPNLWRMACDILSIPGQ